ncbi:tectonic-1-like [Cololabis saira]|uniref:tectonic-1-like n=1 Tax=Cololabis saira TaxID=129043 RepID=UPI002AD3A049|nr:tectonic-1-like [Cololabis saira]
MAVRDSVLFSSALFVVVALISAENTTSSDLNSTTPSERNSTEEITLYETTTETELTTTTPTDGSPEETSRPGETVRAGDTSSPEEPVLPAEPLPVSGSLLTAVTKVDSLCPCDELQDVCDINCCCDRECNEEVSLFTSCSVTAVRAGVQLCSHQVASYSLQSREDGYAELQSSVQQEKNSHVFCIHSYNRVDGLSHPSPALPTDSNFESVLNQFSSFMFGWGSSVQPPAELQAAAGYQYGDVLLTAGGRGQRGTFYLPSPGITAACVNNSPAAFLKDQHSRCSQQVVVGRDCSSLPALSTDTYTNIQLLSGKTPDALLVPVEVSSLVLQSLDGTQTETSSSGGILRPALLNPTLCTNVVLKVEYVIRYSSAGEVVKATVSLVLGSIRAARVTLQQEFHVTYVQEDAEFPVRSSGSPGYVVGLPLVSGARTTDGISRSINPRDTLSLLQGAGDQDCLQGPHQHSPVLFGLDSTSGCTLRVEATANCSLLSQLLLDVLRGPNRPQYVASFGNSPLENGLEWVQIKRNLDAAETQGCNIPLSLHLEIEWTRFGTLVNPQAQIVSVTEIIQTNTSSLASLSGGSSSFPVSSSVSFLPVSAEPLPGYRATPTIDAKLPFDFFFPFV